MGSETIATGELAFHQNSGMEQIGDPNSDTVVDVHTFEEMNYGDPSQSADDSFTPRQSRGNELRRLISVSQETHSRLEKGPGKERSQRTSEPDPWLSGTAPPCTTALEMFKDSTRLDRLSFGCASLDAAFHGGVPVQGITEIAGEAGAGKTQLCLQLLLQAQLPPEAGGLGGKSYVLTCGEGTFPSRRLRQMASRQQKRRRVEPEKLMDGVCIQNAKNLEDQMKIMMEHLPMLMEAHDIKLVVVDSIAALFRSDLGRGRSDIGERSRLLVRLSQQMKRLGDRHRAAFVVVNQVTARPGVAAAATGGAVGNGRETNGNVPAMGMLWSHCINTRFMVHRRGFRLPLRPSSSSMSNDSDRGQSGALSSTGVACAGSSNAIAREITLEMSPSIPVHTSCAFVIERDGISGVGTRVTGLLGADGE